MKNLKALTETFRTVAKHEQGKKKPGSEAPEKTFVQNTATSERGGPVAQSLGDQEFVDDHVIKVTPDANGNGDDVFKGSNVAHIDRKKEKHGYSAKESEQVNEMSKAEISKREDIVKGMKKNLASFKERYGKDAKSVMYATATKMAKEEVDCTDELAEGADAQKRFNEYHSQIAGMMKGIQQSLDTHKNTYGANAHWGHVGDVAHIHDQLRDIHDRLAEKGEYAKEMVAQQKKMHKVSKMMKESVEEQDHKFDNILEAVHAHQAQLEEQQLVDAYASILERIHESLESEEEKQAFDQMLESDDAIDELVEMVESVLISDGE